MPSYADIYGPSTPAMRVGASTSSSFDTKLRQVADRLEMNHEDLRAVMAFETGGTMDPAVRNQAGSGATGLIQFLPSTAKTLGTSTDALAKMTPEQQLEYVEKYFTPYKGKLRSLTDAYMAVLHPASMGKPETATLFHAQQSPTAYQQNAGLDKEKKGFITVGDAVNAVKRFVRPGVAEAATPSRGISYQDIYGSPTTTGQPATEQAPESTTTTAHASPMPATPAPHPGASQGPPAPSPADEQYAAQTLAAMRQRQASLLAGMVEPVQEGGVQRALATRTPDSPIVGMPSRPLGTIPTEERPVAQQPAIKPSQLEAPLEETLTAPETVIPLAIGGVGGGAARTAGTALRPYVAPWLGRAAGALPTMSEAAGNYASRWLNVQLGYEEPGTVGDVVSVAVPLSQRALGAGTRAVTRNLPGAGVVRHEMGEQALEGLGTRLRPRTDADTLFAQAATHNPDIATADMWRTAGTIVRRERRWGTPLRATESMRVAEEMLDLARTHGGPVPLARLEELRQRVGAQLADATGRNRENLSNLYRAIMSDLDSAANRNVPGAEILRGALQTRRLEHGLDTLTDLWSPGKGIQLEQGDITRVYGRRIQNQFNKRLQDDRLFAGSFTPEEVADIQTTLRDVSRLTGRSPVAAPGGLMKHALSASLGTATGMTSGPVTGLMVAAGVEAFPRMMAAAMRSAQGRAAIRRAFEEGGGQLTATGLGMITQAIRDAAGEDTRSVTQPAPPAPER